SQRTYRSNSTPGLATIDIPVYDHEGQCHAIARRIPNAHPAGKQKARDREDRAIRGRAATADNHVARESLPHPPPPRDSALRYASPLLGTNASWLRQARGCRPFG